MTKRVLFVLTNHDQLGDTGKKTGWHCSEASHPYWAFRNAGCEITFVSPNGGTAPMDPSSEDNSDTYNADFMNDPMIQAALDNTLAAEEIQAGNFHGIFFPGGHGPMWDLPESSHIAQAAAVIYQSGGVVGAICHGPAGLLNVRLKSGKFLVEGKELTCFSDAEEREIGLDDVVPFLLETELKNRGALYTQAPNGEEKVVVSERLITGQNPASADTLAREYLKLLEKVKLERPQTAMA